MISLEQLMIEFYEKVASVASVLESLPSPRYQQSAILDALIWGKEKSLKSDEKLLFTRQQAYFAAKIPQYFLK